jgi:hypothetical protein
MDVSPVLRGLRFADDERQLGRVLAVLCETPAVAAAFLQGVLETATGGHSDADRAVGDLASQRVTCESELVLKQHRRRMLRREVVEELGRVDLAFAGSGGWQVVIELKLSSPFGDHQLERYARGALVAAVVRDTTRVPSLDHLRTWLGATSWAGDRTSPTSVAPQRG